MCRFNPQRATTRSLRERFQPISNGIQYPFAGDGDPRTHHLLMRLRVVTHIGKENTLRGVQKQHPRASSKAAKISNVRKMADQQPVKPRGDEMIATIILSR